MDPAAGAAVLAEMDAVAMTKILLKMDPAATVQVLTKMTPAAAAAALATCAEGFAHKSGYLLGDNCSHWERQWTSEPPSDTKAPKAHKDT